MAEVINRNTIRSIIAESVRTALNEMGLPPDQVGASGHLPIKPTTELLTDIPQSIWDAMDSGKRGLPEDNLAQYFGGTKVWEIYGLYSEAMTGPYKAYQVRRSNWEASHPGQPYTGKIVDKRDPVGFFMFLDRMRRGWKGCPMYYFEFKGSYVLGTKLNGVFLVIYFCPTAAAKFGIIEEMCKYDNVVFSVTDDMSRILDMMNLHKSQDKVDCRFRNSFHKKDVYATSDDALAKGIEIIGLTNGNKADAAVKIAQMQQADADADGTQIQNPLMSLLANPQIAQIIKDNPNLTNVLKDNPDLMQDIMQNKDMLIAAFNNPTVQDFITKHPDKIKTLITQLANGVRV